MSNDDKKLLFDDFIRRLLEMGFTEAPYPPATPAHLLEYFKKHPYIRSFDPPESLRSAIKWLNTGGSSLDDYGITVGEWAADGSSKEWGEHDDDHGGSYSFGVMQPNEELLAALASGAEGFTNWFNGQITYSFEAKDKKTDHVISQGVVTVGGKTHTGTDSVN